MPPNNDPPPVVIVAESMAKALFGSAAAVGRRVYDDTGKSSEVIGVVSDMQGSWLGDTRPGPYDVAFHPDGGLVGKDWLYVVRVRPGERDRLIPVVERELNAPATAAPSSGCGRTTTG